MTPTADDLAEIADLPVAEALEFIESRGLVPMGWASDESRAWACGVCSERDVTLEDVRDEAPPGALDSIDDEVLMQSLRYGVARAVTLTSRREFGPPPEVFRRAVATFAVEHAMRLRAVGFLTASAESWERALRDLSYGRAVAPSVCRVCSGTACVPSPATTADLCAALSLDWRRAEVLAREVVRELRKYGHPGGDVRVVWRVVLPSERRPLTVWRAGDVCMTPEGCVGHKGEPITPASQLDAARELATMGLRLGAVTDDAVTLVCLRG